jgi:hypothetical protein
MPHDALCRCIVHGLDQDIWSHIFMVEHRVLMEKIVCRERPELVRSLVGELPRPKEQISRGKRRRVFCLRKGSHDHRKSNAPDPEIDSAATGRSPRFGNPYDRAEVRRRWE